MEKQKISSLLTMLVMFILLAIINFSSWTSVVSASGSDDGDGGGHTHYYDNKKETKATCVSKGKIWSECDCGAATSGTETPIDPKNHTNMKWYWTESKEIDNRTEHWKYCDGCENYEVNITKHSFGNAHTCECGAPYSWGEEHRFDMLGGGCKAYKSSCGVVLSAKAYIQEDLPKIGEYKLVDAVVDYPHVAFTEDVVVTFNVIPYQSKEDGQKFEKVGSDKLTYEYDDLVHQNYNQALTKLNTVARNAIPGSGSTYSVGSTYEEAKEYNNDWIIDNVNKKMDDWNGLWGQYAILTVLQMSSNTPIQGYSGAGTTTYRAGAVTADGHYTIRSVYFTIGSTKVSVPTNHDSEIVMFVNGECKAQPVDINGYLRVGYRTVDGEKFEGLPDYIRHTSVYNNGAKEPSLRIDVQNEIPDKAGYRFVGYVIEDAKLTSAGALGNKDAIYISPSSNPYVDVPLRFTHNQINRRITFYYEKVELTVRHFNMTDGTRADAGLRKIETSNTITKTTTFNQDEPGTVPEHTKWPDYSTNSLSKFWWPAYNLEYATVSTSSSEDLDNGGTFRKVAFSPYKVFTAKITDTAQCTNIVNSSNIATAIRQIYAINNSNLEIDVIERMVNDSAKIDDAKTKLKNAANVLVYGRDSLAALVENKDASGFKDAENLSMITSKLVTVIEDILLSDNDKVNQIKKTVTVPYAPSNSKISEYAGYRSDKWINYYYTTTEIMVNNYNAETGAFMQSEPDASGVRHDLRTKVPIRDTIFRAESLITTPPAIDTFKYTYSVYDPVSNSYARRDYNISGFVLEKFDIKVGDEVLLTVTKEEAEDWYKIDGTNNELYPPFTDQYIIDTSATDGVAALVSGVISQIDLSRLDKDASVNFYYRDVSLLKVKYVRDTDFAEIHPSKSVILGPTPTELSPEDLTPDYEYVKYILDGTEPGGVPPVSIVELPNGQDRELIFVYKVPELEVATPEEEKYYVDLRSNDRVTANNIKQAMYPDAPSRLVDGKYSDTYKSTEEYNSYNDKERLADQTNEGIPTLEDIYANVVSEQFLMDDALTIQPTTQKIELKIVKKYYDTNKKDDTTTKGNDPESQIKDAVYIKEVELDEMEIPYQYYGASGADLKIIENAIVYNNVIFEQGGTVNQTELLPTYQQPYMNYTKNGYLHIPVDRNYEAAIAGMTDYRGLAAGFYSVDNPESRGETLTAVLVLDGIDEYEPTTSKLKSEYQDANGLILTALQNAGTLIKPDRLTVTYNESANGQDNAYIREFLVVTDDFNLNAAGKVDINNNMRLGRTYTADNLEKMEILHTDDIPVIGTDVLYKKDKLFVETKTTNGTHGVSEVPKFSGTDYVNNTVAEVKYVLHQTIKDEVVVGGNAATTLQAALGAEYQARYDEAIRIQTIVGHPVVVHTPIVNATAFNLGGAGDNDYSNANKHTVNPINGTHGTIVLGERFDVTIPHKGQHINSVGYNNNTYNYKGLVANGSKSSKDNALFGPAYDTNFAIIKQIRFDKVGVILHVKDATGKITGGNYYPKNTWIDLPLPDENYTLTIPEWEEEIWDNREIKVETRVAAENIPNHEDQSYYLYYSNTNASSLSYNKNKPTYGVWKTFYFKVIGELRDLEIRATNDPSYSAYKTEGTSGMPLGQQGQANAGKAYQYGIKLGYSVYFDIMSTGWTGDTTESVELTPNFYYVSKNGGEAKPVDLYYKVVGNSNYVKLEGAGARSLTTIMQVDAVKGSRCKSVYASWQQRILGGGSGFFIANAGQEMANTTRLITSLKAEAETNYLKVKNKPIVNYATTITTGNTDLIKLPYSVRLAYTNAVNAMKAEKYAGVSGLEVVPDIVKDYCIGHWYGAFKLPATTVAVDPGVTPKPDKSNTEKGGYIIVTFEDVISRDDDKPYLEVDPERYNQEGAGDTEFTLPNGKPAELPNPTPDPIPAIIYETDVAVNQDAEVGGTH